MVCKAKLLRVLTASFRAAEPSLLASFLRWRMQALAISTTLSTIKLPSVSAQFIKGIWQEHIASKAFGRSTQVSCNLTFEQSWCSYGLKCASCC